MQWRSAAAVSSYAMCAPCLCLFNDLPSEQWCLHNEWILIVRVHNGHIVVVHVSLAERKISSFITCSVAAV